MNFIAAVLYFHAGEIEGFWLLVSLMEKYHLKKVFMPGFPNLDKHNSELLRQGEKKLPLLFAHL